VDIAHLWNRRREKEVRKNLLTFSIDVQYNKGRSQKMAQTLMDQQDIDLTSTSHEVMQEAMEVAQRSARKLRKLQRKFDYLRCGL
jgi:hypothetical protein